MGFRQLLMDYAFSGRNPAYFVRRFDLSEKGKLQKEDFASLAGLTRKNGGSDYKYDNLAYEEFAEIIDKYSSVPKWINCVF